MHSAEHRKRRLAQMQNLKKSSKCARMQPLSQMLCWSHAAGAKAAAKGSTGKGTSANASKAASSEDGSGDDEGAAAETAEVPPSSALPAPKRRAVISDSDDK